MCHNVKDTRSLGGGLSLVGLSNVVFCYTKGTNFFGHLQVFLHLYVDEIGRYVDVFWYFVDKICLFRLV